MRDRLVQAPPGVPVAALLAQGEVDLGVQQLSELMNVDGVEVVGPLPASIAIVTVFSAGIARVSPRRDMVRAVLGHLGGEALAVAAPNNGMEKA